MPTNAGARSATLSSSFEELKAAAAALNQSSDEFSHGVEKLDDALRDLNLGVTAWVTCVNYQDPQQPQFTTVHQLGYAKVGNRRGLALRVVEYDGMDEDDDGEHVSDEWLFGDAPREMRLTAIEHVPSLVKALVKATKAMAGTVAEKAAVALELAGEVEKIGKVGNL